MCLLCFGIADSSEVVNHQNASLKLIKLYSSVFLHTLNIGTGVCPRYSHLFLNRLLKLKKIDPLKHSHKGPEMGS